MGSVPSCYLVCIYVKQEISLCLTLLTLKCFWVGSLGALGIHNFYVPLCETRWVSRRAAGLTGLAAKIREILLLQNVPDALALP